MRHFFIPDTQIRAGVDTEHIAAAGRYVAEKRPDKIIMIGDFWDMPSLSSYDKPGSEGWEDKDVASDFAAGCEAMAEMIGQWSGIKDYNPMMVFCMGNHENRVARARAEPENRKFKKYLSDDNFKLKEMGWKVVPFLKPITLDGIVYCHYLTSGLMDRPIGGQVETRLKTVGHSFCTGHQQEYKVGAIYTSLGKRRRGLVCGSFYSHSEDYVSVQANKKTWRGCFILNEVKQGDYDLCEVSLSYLVDNYS
jgi:hypothetical protein